MILVFDPDPGPWPMPRHRRCAGVPRAAPPGDTPRDPAGNMPEPRVRGAVEPGRIRCASRRAPSEFVLSFDFHAGHRKKVNRNGVLIM